MALMLNETRHANCIAEGEVSCLTLDRSAFDILLGPVQELLIKRMRIRILQSVPLLAKLSETKLIKLASVMRVQAFADGQFIIRQGEQGSRFYIINEGVCTHPLDDALHC
jgi:CRP-like cAMP-binding protein